MGFTRSWRDEVGSSAGKVHFNHHGFALLLPEEAETFDGSAILPQCGYWEGIITPNMESTRTGFLR